MDPLLLSNIPNFSFTKKNIIIHKIIRIFIETNASLLKQEITRVFALKRVSTPVDAQFLLNNRLFKEQ
jgi:hypothetical protein